MRQAVAGRAQAFDVLVECYQRRLYNYCYRMVGNAEDACDVTQEAFVRAYRNIATFRVGEPFAPWLYRIAHNLCIDHLRRKPNTLSLDVEMDEGRDPKDRCAGPEDAAQESETRRLINAAIADLPEKYRSVMLLRHGRGMPLEEIAETLGIPLNTVKVHLHRAREQMRQRLDGVLEVR
ncbi:MAG TPA: sigma-70 family RNA polymerase sigma factor [Armatimonadota bacterium]